MNESVEESPLCCEFFQKKAVFEVKEAVEEVDRGHLEPGEDEDDSEEEGAGFKE